MKNIALIGMPGVGKSTLGVIIAKILGYRFVDTDLIIQEKCKMLLKNIIEKEGVDGFIETENRICASLDAKSSVIATGGSVVYGKDAMEHLRSIGTVVYLKQDFEVISKRLSDIKNRGVVLHEDQTLFDLYTEREPLYRRYAHIICDMSNGTIEDNVERLIRDIREYQDK